MVGLSKKELRKILKPNKGNLDDLSFAKEEGEYQYNVALLEIIASKVVRAIVENNSSIEDDLYSMIPHSED